MENFYLKKYKDKSEKELQEIIKNKHLYQIEAVNAAIETWNQRQNTDLPKLEIPKPAYSSVQEKDIVSSLSLTRFFRSLSYRDFLTIFTMALLLLAFHEIINYYSDERILKQNIAKLRWTGLILCVFINHTFYKIEHGRPNSFMGRVILTLLFLIAYFWAYYAYNSLTHEGFQLSLKINVLALIGFLFLLLFFELAVSFVRFLLNLVKCRIF